MSEVNNNNYKDRRVFERFTVNLPTRFINLRKNVEGNAYVQDVSAKGLCLLAADEMMPFSPVELWLDIPDKGEPLYARGEVVWSSHTDAGNWRVGINLERADLMGVSRILRTS
jgi:hypothetical protein